MDELARQPQPKPCPECGGERIPAKGTPTMAVFNAQVKRLFGVPTSALDALVCTRCGYITFYARNPAQLKE